MSEHYPRRPEDKSASGYLIDLYKHVSSRLKFLSGVPFRIRDQPNIQRVPLTALTNALELIEGLNEDNKRLRRENRLLDKEVSDYEKRVDELVKERQMFRSANKTLRETIEDMHRRSRDRTPPFIERPWRDNPFFNDDWRQRYQERVLAEQRALLDDIERRRRVELPVGRVTFPTLDMPITDLLKQKADARAVEREKAEKVKASLKRKGLVKKPVPDSVTEVDPKND